MILLEFLFIAFIVGLQTGTWLGFGGTLAGLFVLYRIAPMSAVLALLLSLYWGAVGHFIGAATLEEGAGPVFAAIAFAASLRVHRAGLAGLVPRRWLTAGAADLRS